MATSPTSPTLLSPHYMKTVQELTRMCPQILLIL